MLLIALVAGPVRFIARIKTIADLAPFIVG
jgi:hypothetical protein